MLVGATGKPAGHLIDRIRSPVFTCDNFARPTTEKR
jgi:hypothetical protein